MKSELPMINSQESINQLGKRDFDFAARDLLYEKKERKRAESIQERAARRRAHS